MIFGKEVFLPYKSRNKRNYVNIVFIKQHDHTLMLNLSKQLKIIFLRNDNKKILPLQHRKTRKAVASHDDDSKIIIRQYI